ncbi:MAG TPA: aminotransferase class V-fold PLP-dependent enzyme [Steroidobacteraceae bacterium]|nr:aminotransferase class V-fold PLP-dependent enzyme [Steroidobacteraceae bacterium]
MAELFLEGDERQGLGARVAQRIDAALAKATAGLVVPHFRAAEFRRELAQFDFSDAKDIDEVVDWVLAELLSGMTHTTNPRYFGLFNPRPSTASEIADHIVAALNPQLAVWSHAPAAVEIERHTVANVAARLGLPAGSAGHFTVGGSEANYTALLCALTGGQPQFAARGARAYPQAPALYASRDSHLAWFKIAHQAGIGRDSVRLVPTDGGGRMDIEALKRMVAADIAAGDQPVMVVATAGTTNAGMIDPLAGCSQIAREHGLWFHVDAAWGGALAASLDLRSHLVGIEGADSVTVDAHKWLATTMGTGMFLLRRPEILSQVFRVEAEYMPSNDVQRDPYVNTVQWSRRFIGLRLFLSLAVAGWRGFALHVERAVALTARLKSQLQAAGWRVVNDSVVAVLCAQPPDGAQEVSGLVAELVASGIAWVSTARFEGEAVVRVCLTNGLSREADVDFLANALLAARERLQKPSA